ncbi:hypothetical protein, partial [Streptomyces sp. NPDC056670]|uniref:hypothetical protein n=1 Tax=Streptomyces sp. NPDC056670 TaxID=3345904 RepID=UPI0036A3E935
MSDKQNERRVYALSEEHEYKWADLEDLVPEETKVPAALQPFFPTGDAVDEVDGLSIYAYHG